VLTFACFAFLTTLLCWNAAANAQVTMDPENWTGR
jgi:hypothetical protein